MPVPTPAAVSVPIVVPHDLSPRAVPVQRIVHCIGTRGHLARRRRSRRRRCRHSSPTLYGVPLVHCGVMVLAPSTLAESTPDRTEIEVGRGDLSRLGTTVAVATNENSAVSAPVGQFARPSSVVAHTLVGPGIQGFDI